MKPILLHLCLLLGLRLAAQPIALHPENPHYLQYRGRPMLLISSAEHYGAVLNTAFDFKRYLQTMQEQGMNYTRLFTGSYVELRGSFGIEHNTLAPAVGQFLAPWLRVAEPGMYEGEGKFDLNQWDPAYFSRLLAFISEAAARGIVVEVTLFCATYQDKYWLRHPFHPGNNINELGTLARQDFNTLKNEKVATFQKALVEKIVTELNDFDNVIYEISNEPWADNEVKVLPLLKTIMPRDRGVDWALWAPAATSETLAWQRELAGVIVATEKALPQQHLIAQNFANFKQALPEVDPHASILNFHYAWPEVVQMNYGWERPLNFDESGFGGSADSTYLAQAWAFMLAGGAIFNNLDYSFYVGAEDGSGVNQAPGGGSADLRRQLKILHDFLTAFDFVRMQPDYGLVHHAPGLEAYVLSEPGRQYAIALQGQPVGILKLNLPKGRYTFQWIVPESGAVLSQGDIRSKGELTTLQFDHSSHLLALRILRKR